jgi:hypothetical protein
LVIHLSQEERTRGCMREIKKIFARKLRKTQTDAEKIVWSHLKSSIIPLPLGEAVLTKSSRELKSVRAE